MKKIIFFLLFTFFQCKIKKGEIIKNNKETSEKLVVWQYKKKLCGEVIFHQPCIKYMANNKTY